MSNPIRVLVASEGSFLNTGYGKYAQELLTHLHSRDEYQVAELAAYGTFEPSHPLYTPKIKNMPWKIFPNVPSMNDAEGNRVFSANPVNEFGKFRFESTCIEFKPDVVLSFRDWWMDAHIQNSPFRRLYRWVHMPTIDAEPQKAEWLDTYARADILLTYSDWAIDSLKRQKFGGPVFKSAPPAGTVELSNIDKQKERAKRGIPADTFMVGTVMRNQPRKLYDRLFEAFGRFAAGKNAFLYCHTAYPDVGWNIPELLLKYGIADKVIFTYKCMSCGANYSGRFNQASSYCPFCNNYSAKLATTKEGVTHEEMSHIMSMFDLYCQIANSEGFGLPQVEAAAVGVPVMATDYSAMSDVVRKLKGWPVKCTLTTEVETGCLRAVPDIDSIVDGMEDAYKLWLDSEKYDEYSRSVYDSYREHYNWSKTCGVWDEAIKKVYRPSNWTTGPIFGNPTSPDNIPRFSDVLEFVRFCYEYVLNRPDLMYGYEMQQIISHINMGSRAIDKRRSEPVTPAKVLEAINARANYNNFWEQKRVSR